MNKDIDNVLNFETAMSQFSSMFPDLDNQMIELVLRKYDGNVAQTIDELLERSASAEIDLQSPSSSYAHQDETGMIRGEKCSQVNKERLTHDVENGNKKSEHINQSNSRDPCADDEKIALLIQNREFLRYLRYDPQFQRELIGQHQSCAARHYALPPGPQIPIILSSRCSHSPNSRLFNKKAKERDEMKPAIPNGPLIEYLTDEGSESGWTERLKSKLIKKPPEDSEQLPDSPLVNFSDDQMRKGIQGLLSRGGRKLIESLARKFNSNYKQQRFHIES